LGKNYNVFAMKGVGVSHGRRMRAQRVVVHAVILSALPDIEVRPTRPVNFTSLSLWF
jgi:hypothetical protein